MGQGLPIGLAYMISPAYRQEGLPSAQLILVRLYYYARMRIAAC